MLIDSATVPIRFLQRLWQLDSEAAIMESPNHGAAKSGKYLVMLMVRREHLITMRQPGKLPQEAAFVTNEASNKAGCESCIQNFAQLKKVFARDRRLQFVVAELHMLESAAWQQMYVSAVKQVKSVCPVLIWHPKRTKCSVTDCAIRSKAQGFLEQVLDGSTRLTSYEWP